MGSHSRPQRKSSSIFSIFKACCSGGNDDYWNEAENTRRICPSDEDSGRWVVEPGIDRKASAFITRFHETRVSDPEQNAV